VERQRARLLAEIVRPEPISGNAPDQVSGTECYSIAGGEGDGRPTHAESTSFDGNARMKTIVLLTLSNIFMTFAWYGHLKHKATLTIPAAIAISWLIALPEYCCQVPANRLGSDAGFTTPQLKIIQEVITLVVFGFFTVFYMREKLHWNDVVGLGLVLGAVYFVFAFRAPAASSDPGPAEIALSADS
jgi:uncharacterized protein (DUF486 family)